MYIKELALVAAAGMGMLAFGSWHSYRNFFNGKMMAHTPQPNEDPIHIKREHDTYKQKFKAKLDEYNAVEGAFCIVGTQHSGKSSTVNSLLSIIADKDVVVARSAPPGHVTVTTEVARYDCPPGKLTSYDMVGLQAMDFSFEEFHSYKKKERLNDLIEMLEGTKVVDGKLVKPIQLFVIVCYGKEVSHNRDSIKNIVKLVQSHKKEYVVIITAKDETSKADQCRIQQEVRSLSECQKVFWVSNFDHLNLLKKRRLEDEVYAVTQYETWYHILDTLLDIARMTNSGGNETR